MTKEEAITFLKCDRERTCYDFKIGHCDGCNVRTALDMAIVALKAEPKHGHWEIDEKRYGNNDPHCSICHAILEGDADKCRNNYYCYHCGAKMDEVEDGKAD